MNDIKEPIEINVKDKEIEYKIILNYASHVNKSSSEILPIYKNYFNKHNKKGCPKVSSCWANVTFTFRHPRKPELQASFLVLKLVCIVCSRVCLYHVYSKSIKVLKVSKLVETACF